MGQHTWFLKSAEDYLKVVELNVKLDQHDEGIIYLDDLELLQINDEIDDIDDANETIYHDIFRTNKRQEDDSYINDVITSREQCFEWINNPDNMVSYKHVYYETDEQELVHKEEDIKLLNKFWDEYPNGCIYFG